MLLIKTFELLNDYLYKQLRLVMLGATSKEMKTNCTVDVHQNGHSNQLRCGTLLRFV